MPITILVNSEPPELRVAELRDARLVAFDIERGDRSLGNIYCGVIANVVAGMEAFFIDIGLPKKGLLHFKDCVGLSGTPQNLFADLKSSAFRVGKSLLVQTVRPPVGNKGPRLTSRISLPGRYTVLVFPWDTVGVSRRIETEAERARLRALAQRLRPLDYGLIVRTEAEGVQEDELKRDVDDLVRQFTIIQQRFLGGGDPALLHSDLGLLGRIIRDRFSADVERIVVDSAEEFAFCRDILASLNPTWREKVVLHDKTKTIFEHYNVEKLLVKAQQRVVALPHGGSLIIEENETLTAIDVNTGKFVGKARLADTILQTNLEAVEEAVVQLRLRGIGGIIVIDFIDMERTRDRIRVLNALEAALKEDRVKTHIVQLSPSGLVEITRRREGPSLRQLLHCPCPKCDGEGVIKSPESVAIETRRRLRNIAGQHPGSIFKVTLHPVVACHFLGTVGHYMAEMERATQTQIVVRVDSQMSFASTQIEPLKSFEKPVANGIRFTLGMHDTLFPEEAPEFAVWEDCLVSLPPEVPVDDEHPKLLHVIVLEIDTIGRWFATAHLTR